MNSIKRIMHSLSLVAIFGSLLWACQHARDRSNMVPPATSVANSAIIKKPGSSYNDSLIINQAAAVFYKPDSEQLKKIIAVNDPSIYAGLSHDCYYQMRNAHMVLQKDWPHLHIAESDRVRFLIFIKADQSRIRIDLDNQNDICGMFIFDRIKKPVLVDMPNVSTVLRLYFKK